MPLIDLTQLNQEQIWAIQWGRQTANESLKWQVEDATRSNAQIAEDNKKLLPEHQKPLLPVPKLYTDQEWVDEQVLGWVNQQLHSFQTKVEQNVRTAIAAKPLEERLQIMMQLEVEPVLKPE